DEVSGDVHRAVGEAVRSWIEGAVGLEIAALVDFFAVCVFHREAHPRFVEIADFWDKRVADVFILDDDIRFDGVLWLDGEGRGAQGRNQWIPAGELDSKDVHVDVVAGLEQFDCLTELLIEAVVEGNGSISSGPTVRGERVLLCAGFRQDIRRTLHVASLAGGEVSRVEGERISLGELRLLPLVKSGEGA